MQDLSQIVKNIFMANYINKKYYIYLFFFQVKADSNPELQVQPLSKSKSINSADKIIYISWCTNDYKYVDSSVSFDVK